MPGYNGYNYNEGFGRRTTPPPPPSRRGIPRPPHTEARCHRPPVASAREEGNAMGVAGFVLSVVSLISWWIPFVHGVLWLLAVVFSAVGLSRRPRGLALAGLIISIGVPFLVILFVLMMLGAVSFGDMGQLMDRI